MSGSERGESPTLLRTTNEHTEKGNQGILCSYVTLAVRYRHVNSQYFFSKVRRQDICRRREDQRTSNVYKTTQTLGVNRHVGIFDCKGVMVGVLQAVYQATTG